MAVLFGLFTFLGIGGCTREPESISGGTTDKTDPNAPKVIRSKDITEFQASFYLANRWADEDYRDFNFRIIEENGVLTASEQGLEIHAPADEQLLNELQNIIDKYDLASMNGVYKVTAGLAPEYHGRTFEVHYASGEVLKFTINNNPYARWAEEIYTVFAEWFSAQGDDSLYPAKEISPVARLRLIMQEGKTQKSYGGTNVSAENAIDGQTYILNRTFYDFEKKQILSDEFRTFPEDYFERITDILSGYDIVLRYDFSRYDYEERNYGNHDNGYFGWGDHPEGEEDAEDLSLSLHIEYESGKRVYIDTRKASEIEGLRPLLTELTEYLDFLYE